jgi:hypothetical protein
MLLLESPEATMNINTDERTGVRDEGNGTVLEPKSALAPVEPLKSLPLWKKTRTRKSVSAIENGPWQQPVIQACSRDSQLAGDKNK